MVLYRVHDASAPDRSHDRALLLRRQAMRPEKALKNSGSVTATGNHGEWRFASAFPALLAVMVAAARVLASEPPAKGPAASKVSQAADAAGEQPSDLAPAMVATLAV